MYLKNIIGGAQTMISKKITLTSFKTSMVFIGTILLCVVLSIICLVAIYPSINSGNAYADLLNSMPKELLSGLGMSGDVSNFNDYLNMNFYNSIYLYIMITFVVCLSSKLVAKPLGDTSLVYFLNSPVSRKKFLVSQMVVFNVSLFIIFVSSVVFGIISKAIFVDSKAFNVGDFVKCNVGLIVIFLLLGAICFLISTVSNNGSQATTYAATVVIVEYILDMFAKITSKLEVLKSFTIFTVYDTEKISDSTSYVAVSCIIMVVISIILYIASAEYFKRRDLYL